MRVRDWPLAGGGLLDGRGTVLDADRAVCGLLQVDRADLVGRSLGEHLSAEDGSDIAARIAALGDGGAETFAAVRCDAALAERRFLVSLSVFGEGEGRRVGTFVREVGGSPEAGEGRDDPHEDRQGALLREVDAKFRAAFEGSIDAMAIVRSRDGFILDANPAFQALLGYTRNEMIGHTTVGLGVSADPDFRENMLQQLIAEGSVRDLPWRARTKSGEERETLHSAFRIDGQEEPSHVAVVRDVTEQRRRERALAESEAKFSAAFHGSVEAMVISRLGDGLILDVNEAYVALLGYSREELIGHTTLALGTVGDPERRERRVEQARLRGGLRDEPSLARTRTGEIRDCLQTSFLVTIGGEEAWVSILRDMTESRKAERALRESESKFSVAFHGSPDAMVISRQSDGVIIDMNAAHEQLTGYSRDFLIGRNPLALGVVVDLAQRERIVAEVRTNGSVRDVEFPIRRPNGEIRACVQSSFGIELAGEPCMVSIVRDATDARRAEIALRQSEARLRQAVRVADIGIFDHDHADDRIYWSPEQRRIYGFSPDEPVSLDKFLSMVHPGDAGRIAQDVRRAHDPRGEGKFDVEMRIRRRDGDIRWLATRAQTFFEGEGAARHAVRSVGAVIDITEQRQSEEAIRRSESLLAEAQRTAHLGNFERDFLTGRARWSDELYRLLGCEPGAYPAAFQTLSRFTHPDDRAKLEAEYARAFDVDHGGDFEVEHRIVTIDGQVRVLHHRAHVTFDEIGRPVRIFGTSQDVTERRQLESELRQLNQDLETRVAARTAELQQVNRELESFSYTVSHDLRAPLRHIVGYISMFERSLTAPLEAGARARLDVIADAARRMGTLIDSLLAFSRLGRAAMRFSSVDLDALVREVKAELQPDIEGRDIEWEIAPLPRMTADRNLLRLVVTNLVSNALKFTQGRSRALVQIGCEDVDGERVFHVRDNGVGFDMKYADKLFGVFQRLHSASDFPGTGIGLANCRRIIERHGGRIWLESVPDGGTTAYFTLHAPAGASA